MKKFIIIFTVIFLFVSNILTITCTATETQKTNKEKADKPVEESWPNGPKPTELAAESAIVMELSTGLILYEKNIHKEQYPASITKIMTALLCIEHCSLGETVTYSKEAVFGIEPNSSHMSLNVGEKLSMEQSLYGILLQSANEACLGVAEHIAGNIPAFVDMMNEKAKELGCKNTHFMNPNGLHNDKHYTSAYDMALISREAYKNSTFRKIASTKRYVIPPTDKLPETRYMNNHHEMLVGIKHPEVKYEYCVGGKTGYTSKAQSTLVTYAKKGDMELVCVVMKTLGPTYHPYNEYTDSTSLLNYGFDNFTLYHMNNLNESETNNFPIFSKYSNLFNDENAPIYIKDEGTVVLPNNIDIKKVTKEVVYKGNEKEDNQNNLIGTVTYTYGGKTVGSSDIIYRQPNTPKLETSQHVEKIVTQSIPSQDNQKNLKPLIIVIIILVILLILFLYYVKVYLPRKRSEFSLYRKRKRAKENLKNK